MKFINFFVDDFCPPGSGSGIARIRIQGPLWIRIQSGCGSANCFLTFFYNFYSFCRRHQSSFLQSLLRQNAGLYNNTFYRRHFTTCKINIFFLCCGTDLPEVTFTVSSTVCCIIIFLPSIYRTATFISVRIMALEKKVMLNLMPKFVGKPLLLSSTDLWL